MLLADRYRIGEAIGRGGMGEVWSAWDEVLGRAVAVKLLLAGGGDDTASARFRMEAQTAARLNHPHVVAVYDFGAVDDQLYLVMELVDGRSLAQELTAHGPLSPERVAVIGAQAAAGLAAAHQQEILHRDIKPGNLLLTGNGTVKLGDFGIARFANECSAALTMTGQIVGTATYLAPERALGRPTGPASDVYALGCVLYELLAGRPPFQAETPASLLYQHVDAAPPALRHVRPDLPAVFEAYLLRLLAKDPFERPTAQEIADSLSESAPQAPPAPVGTGTGPVTTGPLALPAEPPTARAVNGATARRRRSHDQARQERRVKILVGIAGAVTFGISMAIGMTVFGDGNDASAVTTDGQPTSASTASPATGTP